MTAEVQMSRDTLTGYPMQVDWDSHLPQMGYMGTCKNSPSVSKSMQRSRGRRMPVNTMDSKEASTTEYRAEGFGNRAERLLAPVPWGIIITWLWVGENSE